MNSPHSPLLDRLAIFLSGLCLVHCLLGALLVASMAVAGNMLSHEVHVVGLMLALPLAVLALWRGVRVHGRLGIVLVGVIGIGFLSASIFMPHSEETEIMLSVAGVVVLGAAHVLNLRATRG
ncbi:MerC domain-containing protein [Polymorphobacter sp.]|uniref:MerC domain-containing protein n=1 Tax=Polymorphobacter sp. TaxID=1909290 RepID=UPI003F7002D1